MAVLSAAPLSIPSLIATETVPFTSSLLHQHGEPVQCIPFTTSPFSVLDVAASNPSRSIMISEDLSIDPSSVKPNLVLKKTNSNIILADSFNDIQISAYPVLLPLYLAQYEIKGQKDNFNNMFTFIFKAHEVGFVSRVTKFPILCLFLSSTANFISILNSHCSLFRYQKRTQ